MAYVEPKGDANGFALGQQNAFVGMPSLEAISLGGYWTRIAPSDWYIDARVLGPAKDVAEARGLTDR